MVVLIHARRRNYDTTGNGACAAAATDNKQLMYRRNSLAARLRKCYAALRVRPQPHPRAGSIEVAAAADSLANSQTSSITRHISYLPPPPPRRQYNQGADICMFIRH